MSDNVKIIIIGLNHIEKRTLANKLVELNDNFIIAPTFSTDESDVDNSDVIDYYMDLETLHLAYKNNSLFYIRTKNDNNSYGITIDDYYNNNIFVINIEDFNLIPDNTLNDDVLIVWLDSKEKNNLTLYHDMGEVDILEERFTKFPYLYFLDDDVDMVANVILEYINEKNIDNKSIILNTYS